MSWKKHSPEEIVGTLVRVRDAVKRGAALNDAIAKEGVSVATFFRWRSRYGDLNVELFERMKRLETENSRLREALLELDQRASA